VPGIKGGVIANTLTSNIDIFPTVLDLVFGSEVAKNYRHPNGNPLRGKSLLPALKNSTVMVNQYTFSRYGRCQPINVIQTSACANDYRTGSCNRPLISMMGHSVKTVKDNLSCTYVGWWPFHEIRLQPPLDCAKPTWPNQPPLLFSYGVVSPQIDLKHSYTDFKQAPIQEELYCVAANSTYGGVGYPNNNNLALRPQTKQADLLISELKPAIMARYPQP